MIFSPPKTEFSNFYDVARYNLTWKVCLFLVVFMPILGIALSSLGEISVLPTFFSTFVVVLLMILLKKRRTYFIPALFFSIIGTVLNSINLYSLY